MPTVLVLNLKRFRHNYATDTVHKINSRFEFYEVIDLAKYVDASAPASPSTVYHLHSVLVHSGTIHGGHYYAYVRPTPAADWFRFDDERVRRSNARDAIDDNFGSDPDKPTQFPHFQKYSSAYMLIYVRDSEVSRIFSPIPNEAIPAHLVQQIEQERAEVRFGFLRPFFSGFFSVLEPVPCCSLFLCVVSYVCAYVYVCRNDICACERMCVRFCACPCVTEPSLTGGKEEASPRGGACLPQCQSRHRRGPSRT